MSLRPDMVDHVALRKEIRDRKRLLARDPLVDKTLPRVWVAYVWHTKTRRWILQGFVRMQRVTKKRVDRFRKKMKLAHDVLIRWVELFTAARGIDPTQRYVRHESLRPDRVPSDEIREMNRRVRRRVGRFTIHEA